MAAHGPVTARGIGLDRAFEAAMITVAAGTNVLRGTGFYLFRDDHERAARPVTRARMPRADCLTRERIVRLHTAVSTQWSDL